MERDFENGLVYVNDEEEEVETIMTSVEARQEAQIYLDVERGADNGMT